MLKDTQNRIMQLTLQVPSIYFVNYQQQNIAKQMKLYTALMMYRSEQISAGAACEIAGIDRYTFLNECKKHNISVINYNVTDVENELKQYQNLIK